MSVLTARHPHLLALSDDLLAGGWWGRGGAADARLAGLASLDAALGVWRRDRSERAYLAVAALAAVGSRRGCDDDDAAMAVVLLLQDGIAGLAAGMGGECELDDVVAAVWEEVKRSAPNLGHRAPRYLLARAKARLLSPAHGVVDRTDTVSWETLGADMGEGAVGVNRRGDPRRGMGLELRSVVDEACSDLADLLEWAHAVGVLERADVDLVLELMAVSRTSTGREEAQRIVGERYGLGMRTIRRRRDTVVSRLRTAAPAYLAEVC